MVGMLRYRTPVPQETPPHGHRLTPSPFAVPKYDVASCPTVRVLTGHGGQMVGARTNCHLRHCRDLKANGSITYPAH